MPNWMLRAQLWDAAPTKNIESVLQKNERTLAAETLQRRRGASSTGEFHRRPGGDVERLRSLRRSISVLWRSAPSTVSKPRFGGVFWPVF